MRLPLLRPSLHPTILHPRHAKPTALRHFTLPTTSTPPTHTLTASRHLPYAPLPLYSLITDLPSYPTFLPYVLSARITAWSARADPHHRQHWPASATLEIGYQGLAREAFASRVVCAPPVPGRAGVVEAVGGDVVARLRPEFYDLDEDEGKGEGEGPLARLRTEWRVEEAQGGSEVRLRIEYAFRSQVYEMLGAAVAGRVAEQVVDAFERRARVVLGDGGGEK